MKNQFWKDFWKCFQMIWFAWCILMITVIIFITIFGILYTHISNIGLIVTILSIFGFAYFSFLYAMFKRDRRFKNGK